MAHQRQVNLLHHQHILYLQKSDLIRLLQLTLYFLLYLFHRCLL